MDNKTVLVKQGETKCDYIFIGGCDDVFLVPLELMKGKLDASKVVKQLQAGANIAAARIIPKLVRVFNSSRLRFVANFTELRKRNYRNRPIEFASRVNVCMSNY